ncbi:hypothetical protein MASR1M45_23080 [Candidatus Kapaibacterium sp.]
MKIQRRFTKDGTSPYDLFNYTKRSSTLRNPDGSVVFDMKDIEVPAGWSQLATDILAQKYFRKTGVPQIDEGGILSKMMKVNQCLARKGQLSRLFIEWLEHGDTGERNITTLIQKKMLRFFMMK